MKAIVRHVMLVLGSFVLHFLYFGIPQSFGVIYSELVSVFDEGEGEIGWVASLYPGVIRGAGLISGIMVSAYGACVTTIAGSLLMTVGMVASGFVTSPYLLYVTYGVTAGRRTVAYGIASSGAAAGTIVLPYFTSWCIDAYGWRGCFTLMGGLYLQCVIVGVALYSGERVSRKADRVKQTENTTPTGIPASQRIRKYLSFFNGSYLCYFLAEIPGYVAYFIPYSLLYNMMVTGGQTKNYSSLALSLAGIGSIVSRVLVGTAADYECCNRIYYYIFAVDLCGFITIACVHLTIFWQFLLYGIFYGVGTGIFGVLQPVLTVDLVGTEHLGPALGFLYTVTAVGASIGTPVGGWLKDVTGNYDSSFYFAGACFLSAGLVSSLIPVLQCCKQSGHVTINDSSNKTNAAENGIYVTTLSTYRS